MEGDALDTPEGRQAPPEQSMESLLQEQALFRERLEKRDIVWVKVVQVREGRALVDIGEKREAAIPLSEFEQDAPPAVGSRVPAILVGRGRDDAPAQLSYAKARWKLGWEQILKAAASKARVRGRVTSAVKGGFLVDVGGVSGFLPASLADLRPVRKPQSLVNTGVRCVILEVNQEKRQVILSRKAVLGEEVAKRREKLLSKIKVGDVIPGYVAHCVPAGAFVNIGGVEGFVPTPEVAWREPEKALEGLKRRARLRLKVVSIEPQAGKITLSAKRLLPNPADALKKKYPPKSVVSGKVSGIDAAGVRIVVAENVPAFCAAEELPEEGGGLADGDRAGAGKKAAPKLLWPAQGTAVHAVVLGVHPRTFELSVSIRRYEDIQERKRLSQYLKGPKRLTLGEILTPEGE